MHQFSKILLCMLLIQSVDKITRNSNHQLIPKLHNTCRDFTHEITWEKLVKNHEKYTRVEIHTRKISKTHEFVQLTQFTCIYSHFNKHEFQGRIELYHMFLKGFSIRMSENFLKYLISQPVAAIEVLFILSPLVLTEFITISTVLSCNN